MFAFNPQTLGLIADAAGSVVSALPKQQLARVGLAKSAPALSPLPVIGVVAGGALVTALIIPTSRRWLIDKATAAYASARQALEEPTGEGENVDTQVKDERPAPSDAATAMN